MKIEKYSKTPSIPEKIVKMRLEYRKKGIPTILEDSLNLLLLTIATKSPNKILEIGTATGMSGISMLNILPNAFLTTVEKNENSYLEAKKNFEEIGFSNRVKQYLADAGDLLKYHDGIYDFIFLDGAKARYYDYLPDLKRLLNKGGILFADNVLFRGFIDGEVEFSHRDNTIVRNMRCFLNDLTNDNNYITQIFNIGDGVSISYKKF